MQECAKLNPESSSNTDEDAAMRTIVNIDVPDLQSAIGFYSSALGLQLRRLLDDDVAELGGAASTIYLLTKPEGTAFVENNRADVPNCTRNDIRNYKRHWTPVHIDFVVDDVDAAAERAMAAGAIRESECIEWRGSKCITLSDPFGHGFCFIEFAAGSYSE